MTTPIEVRTVAAFYESIGDHRACGLLHSLVDQIDALTVEREALRKTLDGWLHANGPNGWITVLRLQLDKIADERDALRKFAQAVMQSWPHGDVDGGELQDAAVSAGLLAGWYVIESCGEGCGCEDFPTTCYRPTPLLTGEKT